MTNVPSGTPLPSRWRRARYLIATIAVAAIALIAWISTRPRAVSSGRQEPPATAHNVLKLSPEAQRNANLKTMAVHPQPLERTLVATGVVRADETRLSHIRPLARGVVTEMLVRLGDRVNAGDPLLGYDDIELGELIGEYRTVQAQLHRDEAQAAVARSYLSRAESLINLEAISRKEYELRQAQYQQALANVDSRKAELSVVEEKIHRHGMSDPDLRKLESGKEGFHRTSSHSFIRTPISGVVVRHNVTLGEVLDPTHEILALADTSVVWVLADIYEKDLAKVQIGHTARVRVPAYPDRVFTGKITYISDMLNSQSRTSKVRCVVSNQDGKLKLQMFATVDIPLPLGRKALVVPPSAVQTVDDQTVSFIAKGDSQFEKRAVELGEKSYDWVEIRSGLQPGEQVVTEGAFYLKSALLREQISGE